MDPVSIMLTTIGWLAQPIIEKAVDAAWKKFTEEKGLNKLTDELITELKNFKIPEENAEMTNYLKKTKELVNEAKDLLDELDYFRLQEVVQPKAKHFKLFTRFITSDVPSSLKFDKRGMSKRMNDLIKKLKQTCQSRNAGVGYQLLSSISQVIQIVNDQAVPNKRCMISTPDLFEKIYGRDVQINQIENQIRYAEQHPQEQKVPVIVIVGNGGVGKLNHSCPTSV